MRQRLSLVTLGVSNKERARTFYEALGWHGLGGSDDEPVFFQAGDMIVALWDRASLATDSCVEDNGGWGGITLAHCVESREAVDTITKAAQAAGRDDCKGACGNFLGWL